MADDAASRKLVRENCPLAPGVYGMIDGDGRLIYVGKSKALRERLASYFAGKSTDPKVRGGSSFAPSGWYGSPRRTNSLLSYGN